MDLAPCSNRSAETAGDFVIAKINVRAALRADCGWGRTADLLFSLAFETLDNRAVLPAPQGSKFLANRGILGRREQCSGVAASSFTFACSPRFGANGEK